MTATSAAAMRQAFDQGFARPPVQRIPTQDFIGVSVGDAHYAIAMGEVAGLFADQKIVGLPSQARGFLGVAGLRGRIVPVHALASYLDAPPKKTSRWLLLAAMADIAFAFDAFNGHLRGAPQDIALSPGGGTILGALNTGGMARPIITLFPILTHLEKT